MPLQSTSPGVQARSLFLKGTVVHQDVKILHIACDHRIDYSFKNMLFLSPCEDLDIDRKGRDTETAQMQRTEPAEL